MAEEQTINWALSRPRSRALQRRGPALFRIKLPIDSVPLPEMSANTASESRAAYIQFFPGLGIGKLNFDDFISVKSDVVAFVTDNSTGHSEQQDPFSGGVLRLLREAWQALDEARESERSALPEVFDLRPLREIDIKLHITAVEPGTFKFVDDD